MYAELRGNNQGAPSPGFEHTPLSLRRTHPLMRYTPNAGLIKLVAGTLAPRPSTDIRITRETPVGPVPPAAFSALYLYLYLAPPLSLPASVCASPCLCLTARAGVRAHRRRAAHRHGHYAPGCGPRHREGAQCDSMAIFLHVYLPACLTPCALQAKVSGIAVVGLTNYASATGALGVWTRDMARQGLVGIVMSQVRPSCCCS